MWALDLYISGLVLSGWFFGIIWGVANLILLLGFAYYGILKWIGFMTTTNKIEHNFIFGFADDLTSEIGINDCKDFWLVFVVVTFFMVASVFGWPIIVIVGPLVGVTFLIKYVFDTNRKLELLQKKEG